MNREFSWRKPRYKKKNKYIYLFVLVFVYKLTDNKGTLVLEWFRFCQCKQCGDKNHKPLAKNLSQRLFASSHMKNLEGCRALFSLYLVRFFVSDNVGTVLNMKHRHLTYPKKARYNSLIRGSFTRILYHSFGVRGFASTFLNFINDIHLLLSPSKSTLLLWYRNWLFSILNPLHVRLKFDFPSFDKIF